MQINFNWVQLNFLRTPINCIEGSSGDNPSDGPLVVMLCDKPEWIDTDNPADAMRVMGESAAMTAQNVIGTALDRFAGAGRVLVIPALEVSDNLAESIVIIQKKLKPVAIIGSGDAVSKALVKNVMTAGVKGAKNVQANDPRYLYGWFRSFTATAVTKRGKIRTTKVRACTTLPLDKWVDPDPPVKGADGGGLVNLLESVVHVVESALRGGKNPFSATKYAKQFKHRANGLPYYQTIQNMQQFRRFMKLLKASQTPSFDTEGASLSRVANTNYTLQIALPEEQRLFVLPLHHAEATWTASEHRVISKAMRQYFEFCESKYHIYHNAKFDINQIMTTFGVRWYNHKIYDTGLAEHCLDENRKSLHKDGAASYDAKKPRPFALETIELAYGYVRPKSTMGKDDRGSMSKFDLKTISDYGAVDPLATWAVHMAQKDRAKAEKYKGFLRLVVEQTGNNMRAIARMERNGIFVDADYLHVAALPGSEIDVYIKGYLKKFMESPAVSKANKIIADQAGYRKDGLFGKVKVPWLFDVQKRDHAEVLYLNVLGLAPLTYTKHGKAQLNKKFQVNYARSVPEVEWLSSYKKMSTIKSTFIDALVERLAKDPDTRFDGCVRSSYSQLQVATGRLSSWDINLQNLPAHGKLAKYVKRAFICRKGYIRLKADFSAHEVRMTGNIANDQNMIGAFHDALAIMLELRLAPGKLIEKKDANGKTVMSGTSKRLRQALIDFAIKGDIHIINVLRVFGVQVDKKHPLRQDIKAAIFSLIYGAGPKSLGKGILEKRADKLKEEVYELEAKIKASKKKAERKELREKIAELKSMIGRYLTDDDMAIKEGKDVMQRVLSAWPEASSWLDGVKVEGRKNLYVVSPNGRRRHLPSYLHGSDKVKGAMDRRGPNSVVQGFSSEVGCVAAFLTDEFVWKTFESQGLPFEFRLENMVHDSCGRTCLIELAPLAAYVMEHGMTTFPRDFYRDVFKFDMRAVPYFDLELGMRDDTMSKWEHQRFDELGAILDQKAAESKASKSAIKAMRHNLAVIKELREGELRKDPFTMDKRAKDPKFWRKALMWPKAAQPTARLAA